MHSLDVRCAFLLEGSLDGDQDGSVYGVECREVLLKAPKEFAGTGAIMRLKKVVYGYADDRRRCFLENDSALKDLGFTPAD